MADGGSGVRASSFEPLAGVTARTVIGGIARVRDRVYRAASERIVPVPVWQARAGDVETCPHHHPAITFQNRVFFFFSQSKKPNGRCAWWVRTQGRTACTARRRRLGQSAGRFHCESRLSKSFAEPPASFRGDPQLSAHRDVIGQIRYCAQVFICRSRAPLRNSRVYVCLSVHVCACIWVPCNVCARERKRKRETGWDYYSGRSLWVQLGSQLMHRPTGSLSWFCGRDVAPVRPIVVRFVAMTVTGRGLRDSSLRYGITRLRVCNLHGSGKFVWQSMISTMTSIGPARTSKAREVWGGKEGVRLTRVSANRDLSEIERPRTFRHVHVRFDSETEFNGLIFNAIRRLVCSVKALAKVPCHSWLLMETSLSFFCSLKSLLSTLRSRFPQF